MSPTAAFVCSVYPRWRGEHQVQMMLLTSSAGLSPLARGTRGDGAYVSLSVRFIPAGAGNTVPPLLVDPLTPVYPRWRGEHSKYNQLF